MSNRPNILLLVLDALRADYVEPYGAPPGSSPTLARLAELGAAIPDVRATASWTLPSHVAMFTGQLARGLGLGQAPGETPQSAAPVIKAQRARLLAEVLRQAGYATSGLTTNAWAGRLVGFDVGFERFAELQTARQNELGGGLRQRVKWDLEAMRAGADDGAAEAETVFARWLAARDDRPFFWFANIVECHSPYLPPKPYAPRSPFARLRAADEAFRYLNWEAIMLADLGRRPVPAGALRRMRRLYRACLRYADAWLGRLVDSLDRAGVLDNTLVIVCSDHGENFGVGGFICHGASLDDRLLRVPLVVCGPNADAFEGMLSLCELPSRIAAAVALEAHPWPEPLPSGLPVAQWDAHSLSQERLGDLASQYDLDEVAIAQFTSPLTCAVSGPFKLVRGAAPADESLFDLHEDPDELNPIRDQPAMRARAGDELDRLRAAVNDPAVQASAEAVASPEEVSSEEVADIERRMRLMGYM